MQAFGEVRGVLGLAHYIQMLESFAGSLVRCPDLPSHLRAVPDIKSVRQPYQLWLIDPAAHYPPTDSEKIDQLLGLLLELL